MFRIKVLGTGDAFSRERYNTSFLLSADGHYLALDCPHPYLKILDEAREEPAWINNIIVSHMHGDHISGLDTFLYYKKFIDQKRLNIYSNFYKDLKDHLGGFGIATEDFCDFLPVCGQQCGPFFIEARIVPHYNMLSSCFLISCGGKIVGFSGDTGFVPENVEWLSQADLVFHEVGPAPGHTPYEQLYEKLKEMGVIDKFVLIHYADSFNTHSEIRCAFAGESYIL